MTVGEESQALWFIHYDTNPIYPLIRGTVHPLGWYHKGSQ